MARRKTVKVDVQLPLDERIEGLSAGALGCWLLAQCWSHNRGKRGFITDRTRVWFTVSGDPLPLLRELEGAGMLVPCAGGWDVVDYRKYHEDKGSDLPDHLGTVADGNVRKSSETVSVPVSVPEPDPERTEPVPKTPKRKPRKSRAPAKAGGKQADLEALWNAYSDRFARDHDGSKPTFQVKYAPNIHRLLKAHGLPECLKRLHNFMAGTFWFKKDTESPDFGQYIGHFDKLANPVVTGDQRLDADLKGLQRRQGTLGAPKDHPPQLSGGSPDALPVDFC